MMSRGSCQTDDCNNLVAKIRTNKSTGHISWRKWCSKCHNVKTAKKYGYNTISEISAERAGFKGDVTGYKNSTHPYLKYRKDFCENNHDLFWDELSTYKYSI